MNNPRRLALIAALAATTVLAQTTSEKRIINIQGAPRGDLRNGPLTFSGSPVKATVSTLQIQASQATLAAPAGTPLTNAKGKRTANFSGTVQVTRGGLTAKGGQLAYSEANGRGVLSASPSATFVPRDKSNDPVNISATEMSLDVDNNISTSTGNVQMKSGNQSGRADRLIFDEDKELAQLTGSPSLTRAPKGNQKELVMTGQEVRALTGNKTLYVRGNVKLVQGTLTTTGNAVYYDDKKNVAYVIGNAVSVDSKTKVTVRAPASGALEQRTDLARVRALNTPFKIPTEQFDVLGDK
ncbi:LptA/OstA family protein [Deinococcus apachensis]|uniref:LptA/OstA family protein n=1 Tax=Deinococcus apachensis TaxID=309886 RepID=UPI00037DA72A|nr:LptA/OstA family protein [Deinococcus apachensis]